MKRKQLFVIAAVIALALVVLACAAPAATPAPTPTPAPAPAPTPTFAPMKLIFSTPFPQSHSNSVGAQALMDFVTKQTGGAVTFEPHWGASLGEAAAHLSMAQSGVADITDGSVQYNAGLIPTAEFGYSMAFVSDDVPTVQAAYKQVRSEFPEWEAQFTKQGVKVLGYASFGFYNFASKAPIRTLNDVKGKKVAVIGKYFTMWAEDGGMTGVSSPAQERYMQMQTGLVDAEMLPVSADVSFKMYEVAKYLTIVPKLFTPINESVYINLDKFNKFSPALQKIFIDAGNEYDKVNSAYIIKDKDNAFATVKQNGVTVYQLPDEDVLKWEGSLRDTAALKAAELESKGFPGFTYYKRYQEILAQKGIKLTRQWGVKP